VRMGVEVRGATAELRRAGRPVARLADWRLAGRSREWRLAGRLAWHDAYWLGLVRHTAAACDLVVPVGSRRWYWRGVQVVDVTADGQISLRGAGEPEVR
jgi:hypothetical protein